MSTLQMQKLVFLGTCSGAPTKLRNVSGAALAWSDGGLWLFDCGEGTQHQLLRTTLSPGRISRIFLTHLHGDHCYGLPGLLCSISMSASEKNDEEAVVSDGATPCHAVSDEAPSGSSVLDIYGPFRLGQFLRTALRCSHALLAFRYRVHEFIPPTAAPGDVEQSLADAAHPNELRPRHLFPSPTLSYDVLAGGEGQPTVHA
eukprot:EG_transcript_30873